MTRTPRTAPDRAVDPRTTTIAAPAEPVAEHRERFLDLSLTQVLGGSLAAATAAALGSRLGLVGTITGAAVISLVSAVSASLYTQSLRRTRARIGTRRRPAGALAGAGTAPQAPDAGSAPDPEEPPAQGSPKRTRLRTGARLLAAAVVVFAITAGAVTAWELATGTSLSGSDRTTFSEVARSRNAVSVDTGTSDDTDPSGAESSDPSTELVEPVASDDAVTDGDADTADPAEETEPTPVDPTPSPEPSDPATPADPSAPADPTVPADPADEG